MANCLYNGCNIPIELTLDQLLIYVKLLTYSISYYKIKVNLLVVINYIFIVPIELEKFKKYKGLSKYKKLDSWIKFIESPEVVDMSNKEIVKAKKVLDEISQDEHERYLAEMREKYILDQNATEAAGYDKGLKKGIEQGLKEGHEKGVEEGLKKGHEKGVEEGLKKGHEKGIEEGKKEIVKKMLKEKISIEVIEKVTNLSKDELKKMQQK